MTVPYAESDRWYPDVRGLGIVEGASASLAPPTSRPPPTPDAAMKSRKHLRRNAPDIEALEVRALLSNVTADMKGGDLVLVAEPAATVSIEAGLNGTVLVGGLAGTTINGRGFDSIDTGSFGRIPDDVRLKFSGGRNRLFINGDFLSFGDDVVIKGGKGRDAVALLDVDAEGDVAIKTGAGNDTVAIVNSDIGGTTKINTGSGNDKVGIEGFGETAEVVGNVTVSTGSGNDRIITRSLLVQGNFSLKSGSGDDSLFAVESELDGKLKVNMGSDDDQIWTEDSTLGGPAVLNYGSGFDRGDFSNLDFDTIPVEKGLEEFFVPNPDGQIQDLVLDFQDEFTVFN